MKRRNRAYRLLRLTAVYLLLLPFLLLGWLYSRLPDRVYLEPGQALLLPRFGWVEPMGLHGSQNAASTQVVGSYQTTLSLGGWLPISRYYSPTVTEHLHFCCSNIDHWLNGQNHPWYQPRCMLTYMKIWNLRPFMQSCSNTMADELTDY